MSNQDDPNINRRTSYPMTEDRNYTGWIVGVVVMLAVILGIFAMTSRTDQTDTAANNPNRPAATAPSTTGSSIVPAPSSGQGTAGAPRQTNPPAPAR
jgi:hypothetical protein